MDQVSKKTSHAISGLKHVRALVSKETALTIFNSLVRPLLDYCDVVWDNLTESQATRLQKLKNRAGRVITQQGYDIRSDVIRNELAWGMLHDTRCKHKLIMIYKALNNLVPSYITDFFDLLDYSQSYKLRDRENKIALPRPRTNYLKNSFHYSGAILWNDLPSEVRLTTSLKVFKYNNLYLQFSTLASYTCNICIHVYQINCNINIFLVNLENNKNNCNYYILIILDFNEKQFCK